MQFGSSIIFFFFTVMVALNCIINSAAAFPFSKSIRVSPSGRGNFRSIQDAIDKGVPEENSKWIHIILEPGVYRENVTVPMHKPFIAMEGAGSNLTSIEYGYSMSRWEVDATITVEADDFVAKGITFKNTYNRGVLSQLDQKYNNPKKPAVAALIKGDRNSFYQCSFLGLQDTLFDAMGRHFFYGCYIEGFIDFIFGNGQSVYQFTTVKVIPMLVDDGTRGYITAQKRSTPEETTGFVFKYCNVFGTGKTYLGRAWGPYSRVIFYNSSLSNILVPEGWDAWYYKGHEDKITYAEVDCDGPGSDISKRVQWEKKFSASQTNEYISRNFVNADGWIEKQPLVIT